MNYTTNRKMKFQYITFVSLRNQLCFFDDHYQQPHLSLGQGNTYTSNSFHYFNRAKWIIIFYEYRNVLDNSIASFKNPVRIKGVHSYQVYHKDFAKLSTILTLDNKGKRQCRFCFSNNFMQVIFCEVEISFGSLKFRGTFFCAHRLVYFMGRRMKITEECCICLQFYLQVYLSLLGKLPVYINRRSGSGSTCDDGFGCRLASFALQLKSLSKVKQAAALYRITFETKNFIHALRLHFSRWKSAPHYIFAFPMKKERNKFAAGMHFLWRQAPRTSIRKACSFLGNFLSCDDEFGNPLDYATKSFLGIKSEWKLSRRLFLRMKKLREKQRASTK